MTYSAGIGIITGAQNTPLELAGCLKSELTVPLGLCPSGTQMRSPTMWVGIFCGGFLTAILLVYKMKGAIIIGIIVVSIISWPRNTSITNFPDSQAGDINFDFFKKVFTFHGIKKTLVAQDWDVFKANANFGVALVTFLYVDILDCTGTLYSMARFSGAIDEETQDFEGSAVAYMVDGIIIFSTILGHWLTSPTAFGISIGSLFGLSPNTAFIESAAGIAEGGKTGITAMTTGLCFFISIFFAPIFASIPPWATGCTLIIVGAMMASAAKDINWNYIGDAIPAFVTLAVMPFTYSIAYGLISGIVSYAVINSIVWLVETVTRGGWVPPDKMFKEPWTWRVKGGLIPAWIIRGTHGYV